MSKFISILIFLIVPLSIFAGQPDNLLIVELVSFSAEYIREESLVQLKWQTASESNNKGFSLERKLFVSDSATEFNEIAFIQGAVSSSELKSYEEEDYTIKKGYIYIYRLKIQDYDGTYNYSNNLSVNIPRITAELIDFSAILRNNKVELSWSTALEEESLFFEIYKASSDKPSELNYLTGLKASGNKNSKTDYGPLRDSAIEFGKTYIYKLFVLSLDSARTFLSQTELDIPSSAPENSYFSEIRLACYPNPANEKLNIEYEIICADFFRLSLLDIYGKEFAVLANEFQNVGRYNYSFNCEELPAGLYYFQFVNGADIKIKKILIIK